MPNNQVTLKFNGLTEALRTIDTWSEEKLQAVRDAVNESALNIQTEAKRRCPVDMGRLRASIQIEPAQGHSIGLKVGTNVEYAPYVEWGTGIYASHPFFESLFYAAIVQYSIAVTPLLNPSKR